EITVQGHPIYSVDGAGDRSFYFQSGAWVIWLQTTGKDPLSIVTDGIVKFPDGGPRGGY
ncbi:MAG: hypothetical protein HY677_06515, partial [Chloroflexi bacterium]|nr:hypothetical protein [Chloroflexota bacterium]